MRYVLLILLALWAALTAWWYACEIRCACSFPTKVASVSAPEAASPRPLAIAPEKKEEPYPLRFECNSASPILSKAFEDLKRKLIQKKGSRNVLEIIGLYSNEETNPSRFANLGLARANNIKELFEDKVAKSRINVVGRVRSDEVDCEIPFIASSLEWRLISEQVKELGDKTLIYFPKNSSQKEASKEIDDYLEKLAQLMSQEPSWMIGLTGHTDDRGEEKANALLGLERANAVKEILVNFGVEENRVLVSSRGETQAIANNDTEEGRNQNRRVELKIKR